MLNVIIFWTVIGLFHAIGYIGVWIFNLLLFAISDLLDPDVYLWKKILIAIPLMLFASWILLLIVLYITH